MTEIEADWVLALGDNVLQLLQREMPRLLTHQPQKRHNIRLRLPGATIDIVLYERCRLFLAPPEIPLDKLVKFLFLDLVFSPMVLDVLHAECGYDLDKMCREINRRFDAAPLN